MKPSNMKKKFKDLLRKINFSEVLKVKSQDLFRKINFCEIRKENCGSEKLTKAKFDSSLNDAYGNGVGKKNGIRKFFVNGFRMEYVRRSVYGHGMYFSDYVEKCIKHTGSRRIIMSRVLMG